MDNWKFIRESLGMEEERLSKAKITIKMEGLFAGLALLAIGFVFGFTLGVFA